MRAGACVQCEGPGIAYIIVSLLFVLTWFPVLRLILTRYVKSFYTSIAFVQFMGLYASFAVPWSSNLKSLFAGLGSVNLNLDLNAQNFVAKITPLCRLLLKSLAKKLMMIG